MLFPVLAHLPSAHLQVVPRVCVCVCLKSAHTQPVCFQCSRVNSSGQKPGLHGKMFFLLGINVNKSGNFPRVLGVIECLW